MLVVGRIRGRDDHKRGLGRVVRVGMKLLNTVLPLPVSPTLQCMQKRFVLEEQPAIGCRESIGFKQLLPCLRGDLHEQAMMMIE